MLPNVQARRGAGISFPGVIKDIKSNRNLKPGLYFIAHCGKRC